MLLPAFWVYIPDTETGEGKTTLASSRSISVMTPRSVTSMTRWRVIGGVRRFGRSGSTAWCSQSVQARGLSVRAADVMSQDRDEASFGNGAAQKPAETAVLAHPSVRGPPHALCPSRLQANHHHLIRALTRSSDTRTSWPATRRTWHSCITICKNMWRLPYTSARDFIWPDSMHYPRSRSLEVAFVVTLTLSMANSFCWTPMLDNCAFERDRILQCSNMWSQR